MINNKAVKSLHRHHKCDYPHINKPENFRSFLSLAFSDYHKHQHSHQRKRNSKNRHRNKQFPEGKRQQRNEPAICIFPNWKNVSRIPVAERRTFPGDHVQHHTDCHKAKLQAMTCQERCFFLPFSGIFTLSHSFSPLYLSLPLTSVHVFYSAISTRLFTRLIICLPTNYLIAQIV